MTIIYPVLLLSLLSFHFRVNSSSTASTASTTETKVHRINELLNFVSNQGGDFSKLKTTIDSNLDISFVATQDIKHGSVLMHVPLSTILSYNSVTKSNPEFARLVAPFIGKPKRKPSKVECLTTLSLFIAMQKLGLTKQNAVQWQYFLNTLPQLESKFGLPHFEWVSSTQPGHVSDTCQHNGADNMQCNPDHKKNHHIKAIEILRSCPSATSTYDQKILDHDHQRTQQLQFGLTAALEAIAQAAGVTVEQATQVHEWAYKVTLTRANYQLNGNKPPVCCIVPVFCLANHRSVPLPLMVDGRSSSPSSTVHHQSGGVVLLKTMQVENEHVRTAKIVPFANVPSLLYEQHTLPVTKQPEYSVGMLAASDIKVGEAIFNNYYAGRIDPPCHTDLLFVWGFLPNDDTKDEWCIDLSTQMHTFLPSRTHEQKLLQFNPAGGVIFSRDLIQSLDKIYPRDQILPSASVTFRFRESWIQIPGKIMAIMRLNHCDTNDLKIIDGWLARADFDMHTVAVMIGTTHISTRNELAALEGMGVIFQKMLTQMPGTAKEDQQQVDDMVTDETIRTALRVRLHERKICQWMLVLLKRARNEFVAET